MLTLVLPWPPKELNANSRVHWTIKSRATKLYRKAAWLITKNAIAMFDAHCLYGSIEPLSMELEFIPPDNRKRDDDNCIASFKAARDGIADALRVNDNLFRIKVVIQHPNKGKGAVCVKIQKPSEISFYD